MKITKSRLRQIIREEIRAAAPDPIMGSRRPKNARDLAKMIAGPAKTFGAYERPDELQEYPLSVYADLMGVVIDAWGRLANNVHGCKMNSETKECQIISSVMKDFHSKIGPFRIPLKPRFGVDIIFIILPWVF